MSAERMAEIEARLADLRGHHPHFNDYVRAERAFVTYAPIDLRWLLDRVRELEGEKRAAELSALESQAFAVLNEKAAARSPSGEGQP